MSNPTRRMIALAALAVAIIAAAVALELPSAAAQSDDEQTGRIVAQRLADGRTEFGWQPTGAARVLPRARYFPTDARVDRWLNSSPVEVDGAQIGRINARLRDDGRIEFGFTPTDGERILPPSRYFPRDARVDRWLRSTEITISAPPTATGFVAVSAGVVHTCGLRVSGAIECWGEKKWGATDAPAGRFTAVSAGARHSCGLRESGAIECWGDNTITFVEADGESREIPTGQTDAPAGSFTAVSAGEEHSCGLRESGAIECWGDNQDGQTDAPTDSFSAVAANRRHTCAIRESGAIECWGSNTVTLFGADGESREIPTGQTDAPAGSFTAVAAGLGHTCGLRDTSAIECWGWNGEGQNTPPAGSFTAVAAGLGHTCGLRTSGAIECWGSNFYGQATAPAP